MSRLSIVSLFLLPLLSGAQVDEVYSMSSDQYGYDHLILKPDGTYTYESRGDSCWTWHDFTGSWNIDGDYLILNSRSL